MQTLSESVALLARIIIALTTPRRSWFERASADRSISNFKRLVSWCDSTRRPSLLPASTDWRRSRRACKDSTLAPAGNLLRSALCGGESVTPATPAKAVFIFVCPFVSLAQECAVSFTPRQLQKGDWLRKNGRLRDLFGVAEEALSGRNWFKLC